MAVSSSSEEATSALTGAHLLLRSVELRGREFLGPSFIGYDALLHLLIVSSDPENLPRSYDTIVKGVHYVEDVPAAETHLAFLRLLVMEMSSTHFTRYNSSAINLHELIKLILNRINSYYIDKHR